MRILIVCSYKPQLPDGVAPFVREQVEALRAWKAESQEPKAESEKVTCEYYHIKGKGLIGYLWEVPKLRRWIHDWKPDVIHAHYGMSCLLANMATRRIPVVSTYHGSDINSPMVRPLSKIAMRLSAWNIFVSKRNMALAGAVEGQKCSLIPCGINLPLPWSELKKQRVGQLTLNQWVESVLTPGRKHVLFAGAFDNAVKDPMLAKQAITIANKFETCNLKSDINSSELDLIELKGYTRNQVYALMYACDALLMASKAEGSPQVIKEAMACGCPIVSVDVGDVAERIEGVEGCYIAESREPREIAEALKQVIAFGGKTNGRKRIEELQLTNEAVAKRIVDIYNEIIKK